MPILKLQEDLRAITVSLSLFHFANGLIGVFVPLILLSSGATLPGVALYYVAYSVVKLCLNYPTVRLTQTRGPHAGLALGFLGGAGQLAFLYLFVASQSPLWMLLSAMSLSLSNAAIWNSVHIHISRMMSAATKSSSLATMEVVRQVLGVVAPFSGGLIGLTLGPSWLVATAAAFVVGALVSIRPLASQHLRVHTEDSDATATVSYRLKHAPKRDVFANFCFNIETAVGGMVWPIFLAVELVTYEAIGSVAALAALVTIGVVVLAGHRGDRGQDRKVLREGVALVFLFNIARLFPLNPVGITGVSVGYRSSLAYMMNSWTSTYYSHTKRLGIPYVMSMEIACDLAYLALWSALLAVALVASGSAMFTFAFVAAGLAAWGCLAISTQRDELISTGSSTTK